MMLGLFAAAGSVAGEAYGDVFEFLTYTPPPGWTIQASPERTLWQRQTGIGMIAFSASHPTARSASDEFAEMWRARIEPTLPGTHPQPQIKREGDYAVAFGTRQYDTQGTITTVTLAVFVGRGRALGVVSMFTGDDVLGEVTAFFDSIKITQATPATTAPNSDVVTTGEIEVDFDVPPGYVSKREGKIIALTPTSVDHKTPCVYGIGPSRRSTGSLDADARAAILEVLPGWQIKDDSYNAMRGVAGDGWNYYWFRTLVHGFVGGSYQSLNAMTMAFSSGAGRVSIVWGFGNPARCLLDDLGFAQLFHSLRPRGWTSDGGKALTRELRGTWRNSQRLGIAQYKFMDNERYECGIGSVTQTGLLERTSSSVSDGRYTLRGAELTLTSDRRDRGVSKYRVRIYDEFVGGRWTRAMSLFDESANPALEVQYMRIEN